MTSRTETLNCDISSLDNDTEMVDHSMNPKFLCAYLLATLEKRFVTMKRKFNSYAACDAAIAASLLYNSRILYVCLSRKMVPRS